MKKQYYAVQIDFDEDVVSCETLQEVYNLLKKHKLISVLRYNDNKTGAAYTKAATEQGLIISSQEQVPICIKTVLSDEEDFVCSEAYWIENCMLDEFYNPERMPYIETIIKHNSKNL